VELNFLVDEIQIQALLRLRNKIVDVIQDEFAREMNHFVYEEPIEALLWRMWNGWWPSQMHNEQEDVWICHYEEAKNIETLLNSGQG